MSRVCKTKNIHNGLFRHGKIESPPRPLLTTKWVFPSREPRWTCMEKQINFWRPDPTAPNFGTKTSKTHEATSRVLGVPCVMRLWPANSLYQPRGGVGRTTQSQNENYHATPSSHTLTGKTGCLWGAEVHSCLFREDHRNMQPLRVDLVIPACCSLPRVQFGLYVPPPGPPQFCIKAPCGGNPHSN